MSLIIRMKRGSGGTHFPNFQTFAKSTRLWPPWLLKSMSDSGFVLCWRGEGTHVCGCTCVCVNMHVVHVCVMVHVCVRCMCRWVHQCVYEHV